VKTPSHCINHKSSAILRKFQQSTAFLQTFDAEQHGTINCQRQSWAPLVWYEIHTGKSKGKRWYLFASMMARELHLHAHSSVTWSHEIRCNLHAHSGVTLSHEIMHNWHG
jgi:hypothetical protein